MGQIGQYLCGSEKSSKFEEKNFSIINKTKKIIYYPLNNSSNLQNLNSNIINEHHNDMSILSDDDINENKEKPKTKRNFNSSYKKESGKQFFNQIVNKNNKENENEKNDNNFNENKNGKDKIMNKTSFNFTKKDKNNLFNKEYDEQFEEVNIKNKPKN